MEIMLPPPCDLGAPSRYTKWRKYQKDAVWAAAESKKRFIIQGQPTGSGKSLTYVCQALLTDARCVVLTSTKALMAQLADPATGDFIESGMIEIRGLNSYECVEGRPAGIFGNMKREGYRAERGLPMACDEAPCQSGAMCGKRDGGCLYYDAYRRASWPSTKLIVTNYAYWMSINRYGEGLGEVGMLVLDEAHNAFEELGKFVGTSLRRAELDAIIPGTRLLDPGADQEDWKSWAAYWLGKVVAELEAIRQAIKDTERMGGNKTGETVAYSTLRRAKELRNISRKLSTIATMRDDWVIDWAEGFKGEKEVKFDPVAPGSYAESTLFLNIPKVVMVSATARPETAEMLGIERSQVDFKEYPSNFPVANRPVIYIPTGQMNKKMAEDNKYEWHARIDHIIGRRLDRKGLIHTVSYPRARDIFLNSQYRERMVMHDNTNTREVIAQFKASRDPLILVSPVLGTGYDFPHDQARYQIIAKMPFPVTVDKVMKARNERWPWYRNYVTMVELVQMAGRIVRAEDDWGECVDPSTRVLTNDLRWVQAGDIDKGQKLLSIEEKGEPWAHRKWKWSTVVKSVIRKMPRVRVITDKGDLICTPNHPWLVFARASDYHFRTLMWQRSDKLVPGDYLSRFIEPWKDDQSWLAGWLAGFADGEGCLVLSSGKRNPNVCKITIAQNEGPTLRFATAALDKLGFQYGVMSKKGYHAYPNGRHIDLYGGITELLRFIGQVRPQRLLSKFTGADRNEWTRSVSRSKILAVEKMTDGPISSLQTTAKTYIAEGYGAHNTFIIDSDFAWWYYGKKSNGRAMCANWFNESISQQQMLGPAMKGRVA